MTGLSIRLVNIENVIDNKYKNDNNIIMTKLPHDDAENNNPTVSSCCE